MSKAVKIAIVTVAAVLSFVAGVKYAEQVKSHASWMFESKDDEVALPDLSNEEIEGATSAEQDILTNGKAAAPEAAVEAASAPMDSVAAPETAAPAKK